MRSLYLTGLVLLLCFSENSLLGLISGPLWSHQTHLEYLLISRCLILIISAKYLSTCKATSSQFPRTRTWASLGGLKMAEQSYMHKQSETSHTKHTSKKPRDPKSWHIHQKQLTSLIKSHTSSKQYTLSYLRHTSKKSREAHIWGHTSLGPHKSGHIPSNRTDLTPLPNKQKRPKDPHIPWYTHTNGLETLSEKCHQKWLPDLKLCNKNPHQWPQILGNTSKVLKILDILGHPPQEDELKFWGTYLQTDPRPHLWDTHPQWAQKSHTLDIHTLISNKPHFLLHVLEYRSEMSYACK